MELIQISDNQLKVMMNAEDMEKYKIKNGCLSTRNDDSRLAFRNILDYVHEKTGFQSTGHKIYVTYFPSSHGGCELFISNSDTVCRSSGVTPSSSAFWLGHAQTGGFFIYSFDKMSYMLDACKRLHSAKYQGESRAYKDMNGNKYYLTIEIKSPLPCEQGGVLLRSFSIYYINEHCSLICANAVETLSSLA